MGWVWVLGGVGLGVRLGGDSIVIKGGIDMDYQADSGVHVLLGMRLRVYFSLSRYFHRVDKVTSLVV